MSSLNSGAYYCTAKFVLYCIMRVQRESIAYIGKRAMINYPALGWDTQSTLRRFVLFGVHTWWPLALLALRRGGQVKSGCCWFTQKKRTMIVSLLYSCTYLGVVFHPSEHHSRADNGACVHIKIRFICDCTVLCNLLQVLLKKFIVPEAWSCLFCT